MKDLYEKDKSANMRIQTDFYEDKNSRKKDDQRRRPARFPSAKGEKTFKAFGLRSQNKTEKKDGITAARKTRKDSIKKDFYIASKAHRNDTNNSIQDLSRLSMEERMALYKKKYAGSASDYDKNKEQQTCESEIQPDIAGKTVNPGENEIQKKSSPAGKGILSKLIGIFRKK